MSKTTFEDKIVVINNEINKRRSKWHLKALPWLDFDDVSQIILIHVYKKWDKWNQDRPLEPWLNRIITHQIRNLIRNNYSSFARPCLKCSANQGGNLCSIYGIQSNDCPLMFRWEKTRKRAYNTKLPVSIEHHEKELFNMPTVDIDIEKSAEKLHIMMEKFLKPSEWKIYQALYIENLSDEEVAKIMGYKTNEKNRTAGYKRIKQIKKIIINKVKEVIAQYGVE